MKRSVVATAFLWFAALSTSSCAHSGGGLPLSAIEPAPPLWDEATDEMYEMCLSGDYANLCEWLHYEVSWRCRVEALAGRESPDCQVGRSL